MAKRDMKTIEARRLEGARPRKRKLSQVEVAGRLGVTRPVNVTSGHIRSVVGHLQNSQWTYGTVRRPLTWQQIT